MKIAIASDHAGFAYKEQIKMLLQSLLTGCGISARAATRLWIISFNVPLRLGGAFVNVRRGRAINQEVEQVRSAVVAARVHQLFALVDEREIKATAMAAM